MTRQELTIASGSHGEASADILFRLGLSCATGMERPVDYVAAHKWFNLAAQQGSAQAMRLRREIAAEMSQTEIAAAQRAARDFLKH